MIIYSEVKQMTAEATRKVYLAVIQHLIKKTVEDDILWEPTFLGYRTTFSSSNRYGKRYNEDYRVCTVGIGSERYGFYHFVNSESVYKITADVEDYPELKELYEEVKNNV